MKVYFDGVQIGSDYIYELPKEHQLFNETFRLGSVSARTYKLTIEKGVASVTPSVITITDDNDNSEAVLQVDSVEEVDDLTMQYNLVDAMVNLSFNYDASTIVPTTTMGILQDICSQANLTLANDSFDGDDIVVDFYDNTLTGRDYVSYIAELNGGYAIINADGELELKKYSNTSVDTIAVEDCENFKLGEHHIIKRVVYDDASGTAWSFGDDEAGGDTLYLDINNPFIYAEETVEAIYDSIVDFEYYCLSTDNCPIGEAVAGETITFTLGNESYPTIAQISQECSGNEWFGGYKLDLATSVQEETKVTGETEWRIKRIQTNVNRLDNEFSRLVTEVAYASDLQDLASQVAENTTAIVQNSTAIELRALQSALDNAINDSNSRLTTLENRVVISAEDTKFIGSDDTSYTYVKYNEVGMVVDNQTQFRQTPEGTNTHSLIIDNWHLESANSGNSFIVYKKASNNLMANRRARRR